MYDPVKIAVWICLISLAIAFLSSGVVVYYNSGSRNLILGLGTLGGTIVLFAVGLFFELQQSRTAADFGIEIVVDPARHQIQFVTGPLSLQPWPHALADELSKIYKSSPNPPPDSGDQRLEVGLDAAFVYLVFYYVRQQMDWQLDSVSVASRTLGAVIVDETPANFMSGRNCTEVDAAALQEQFGKSGNRFSKFELGRIGRPWICLPPKSTIALSNGEIAFNNPICNFTLRLDPLGGADKDNKTVFLYRVRAVATYSRWRAQASDLGSYQSWVNRTIEGGKLLHDSH